MKLDREVWGNVFPELVGPNETQRRPILGFRINRVQLVPRWSGNPWVILRSMSRNGYLWEAGRNQAACLLAELVPDQRRHVAPGTECSCGLYAVHNVDQLTGFRNLDSDGFVLLGVAGSGIVRVHEYGWRAQFARIVAFSVELPEIPPIETLTPRERRVLQLRFGLIDGRVRTLEQVGKKFGLTADRIQEIEAEALRQIQANAVPESQGRLSAMVAEALEAKYQVPIVPLDGLKDAMAGAGSFWEEMR